MGRDDQRIPDEAGDHHTWSTAPKKKYVGKHRDYDKTPKEDKDKDKK